MKKLSLALAALLLIGISSCKKDDDNSPKDTTKPSVQLNSPSKDDEFTSGNDITISATVNDDTELSQAKIEIHENFDGHAHMKNGSPAFEWDSIINLSGKTANLNFKITLPIDIAAGNYDFTMRVIDKAGNEADFIVSEIVIKNAEDLIAPTLNVNTTPAPDANNEIELKNSNEITIEGTVGDDKGLKSYEIKLIHEGTEKNYVDIDGNLSGTGENFTEKIIFDPSWPKGEYELIIEAFDLKNNDADVEYHVHWD